MGYNFDGISDWGKWGICGDPDDLYPAAEQMLRAAISSGDAFETGWHGFGKCEASMRIIRDADGKITVLAHQEMDSALDDEAALIYDCLTDAEADAIDDATICMIQDVLCCTDYQEVCTESTALPADASYDDALMAFMGLVEACEAVLRDSYLLCMDVTLSEFYGYPEDRTEIERRLAAARAE